MFYSHLLCKATGCVAIIQIHPDTINSGICTHVYVYGRKTLPRIILPLQLTIKKYITAQFILFLGGQFNDFRTVYTQCFNPIDSFLEVSLISCHPGSILVEHCSCSHHLPRDPTVVNHFLTIVKADSNLQVIINTRSQS